MKARRISGLVCGASLGLATVVAPPVLSEEAQETVVPNVRVKATGEFQRRGTGKPTPIVDSFTGSFVIPGGSLWDSAVRFGEQCTFDLRVEYDQTFKQLVFDDRRVIMQIEISDRYTNLSTGVVFVDRARYSIDWDFATGLAVHRGTMWQVNVEGAGIEVHDVGMFIADFGAAPPPFSPIIERHGSFDVNVYPFGTLSYCDWAEGIFP